METPDVHADVWDAPVFHQFKGVSGEPFISGPEGEGRYLFSLSVDGFNPFQAKEAKQNVMVTGIYMVCLNLPMHLRYLPENTYLVGVIPGPGKPSLEQINHFLQPLVDELLDFWNCGVFFTHTASYPDGRRARCALVPLVCDLPGARQVAGHASHSAKQFCSFCKLTLEDMENIDPKTWVPRTARKHRDAAMKWKAANTPAERQRVFEETGVRWSDLLRLPYWDPIMFTVIDTMHNHYLGLLKTHCRDIWGMSIDVADGTTIEQVPPKPNDEEFTIALRLLRSGTDQSLELLDKNTLWHLCHVHGLHWYGNVKRLRKQLYAYVRWAEHF